ncbi:MAG: thiol:disulfide interchange protein DsbD [Oleiphilaceae bacterium]|jgi:thiol:disulfide interchange protein DsbD
MHHRTLSILFSLLLVACFNANAIKGVNTTSTNSFSTPEFLKVDEAFIFNSEMTDEGLKLNWEIADGYYLYQERFKFKPQQTSAVVGQPKFSIKAKEKEDPYFGKVHIFKHQLEILLPIQLSDGESDVEMKISYQGCADAGLCYPPKHQYVLYTPNKNLAQKEPSQKESAPSIVTPQTPISSSNASDSTHDFEDADSIFSFLQNGSLPVIIGIFFLLGLGLTFTPCVFPMIPIITSIIAGQKAPTVAKSLTLSITYVLGMAITYATAGVITGMLGASANIQAALQDPYLLAVFATIFILLALAMFGLYELQLPASIRDRLNTKSQKLHGGHIISVFFIGALSALVVSPCVSAPLAGALLYISSTADAVIGGASLFALGIGMGVPLIIIAVGGGKFLPKAGAWMDNVKAVFGVMLIAVAIWLISRVIPAEVSLGLWAILVGLTATQMGAFDAAKAGWQRISKGLGILLALYAAMLTIGAFTGASNPLKPLQMLDNGSTNNYQQISMQKNKVEFEIIYDLKGLNQHLRIAKEKGLPAVVDFYADWCISCIVMENQVFPLPEIHSKLNQFYLIKADVTENSDKSQALLEHYGLFGPPSILLFNKTGEERDDLRIVGEISKEAFETRLINALK